MRLGRVKIHGPALFLVRYILPKTWRAATKAMKQRIMTRTIVREIFKPEALFVQNQSMLLPNPEPTEVETEVAMPPITLQRRIPIVATSLPL
ncbi:hypothetical protein PVK06_002900 [Gossypium arboreum]|uniref:Uncharacterized protein n=1 Tax=Gossypium arboreum TaxID=29729 RepID=A0ABR0R5Y7_GOSAR|nr:hypothetical protein PVK06_002900 [Gossypium arboreum]